MGTFCKLKTPIKTKTAQGGEVEISKIELSCFRTKHLKYIPQSMIENGTAHPSEMLPLIGALSGLTVDELGELEIEDLMTIIDKTQEVMGKAMSPKTGEI